MKILLGLYFIFSTSAFAGTPCSVYGISDSPQRLECTFKKNKIVLDCKDGAYYVNEALVSDAFHYEVEDGPVPLVFKTASNELVVTLGEGKTHLATFQSGPTKSQGKCQF